MNDTRWGVYDVVGHYDGDRFSLTEPATAHEIVDEDPNRDRELTEDPFRTRCPEPPGGWRPVDPVTATHEALDLAAELAQAEPGYSAVWIDQKLSPGVVSEMDTDPARIILNMATTGDTIRLERTLRKVWGGALCVSRAGHTDAELATIQDAVRDTPGMLRSSRNALAGRVDLTLIRATRQLQAHFDATYGQGLVHLAGALAPLD